MQNLRVNRRDHGLPTLTRLSVLLKPPLIGLLNQTFLEPVVSQTEADLTDDRQVWSKVSWFLSEARMFFCGSLAPPNYTTLAERQASQRAEVGKPKEGERRENGGAEPRFSGSGGPALCLAARGGEPPRIPAVSRPPREETQRITQGGREGEDVRDP
ncbi:hypothetical protein NHX12_031868 [Muraenolepis orangiensis]|uniref:Uncharacterized protein n=1 Tax=Muraenolepis orangiensis TaxID=630683 RepID=A0A9Q0IJC7_9TELE|nr:hypothetical protein NHX12_031868 [Muraenolepis orangiensis]